MMKISDVSAMKRKLVILRLNWKKTTCLYALQLFNMKRNENESTWDFFFYFIFLNKRFLGGHLQQLAVIWNILLRVDLHTEKEGKGNSLHAEIRPGNIHTTVSLLNTGRCMRKKQEVSQNYYIKMFLGLNEHNLFIILGT